MSTHLDFPFHVDAHGRSATTTDEDHVRDMVEQLLFTIPGERVNRPDFGTGVLRLVFAPNSPELAGAVEYTLQAALQQWLPDDLRVERVDVRAEEGALLVSVAYVLLLTGELTSVTVERRTGP
ncbi:GPW/gp25 family protein [Nonomuraea angiospora]|uniref:Phage baseplate assembly protein W n=1 Tax=Nonomuraea angiospora TaxID=46172 RepID=A0ABR9LSL9_9ACTN|nr:GPW/gp25 family protein [Nonomuraea angiospora]MBE1583637.1 phage baseplate assembly protein W [Nonomuraea angiospora]MDX3109250.1 GPW/gp25 family protein [Nonomuraea angiospora]